MSFDYAVDFDINYSEGTMSLSDFEFSKDFGGSNSERKIDFSPMLHLPVKNYIRNNFYEQFEIARKNYTKIGGDPEEEEY